MSRTFKDKPYKLKHEKWNHDTEQFQYIAVRKMWGTDEVRECVSYGHIDLPTTKTKKRKKSRYRRSLEVYAELVDSYGYIQTRT